MKKQMEINPNASWRKEGNITGRDAKETKRFLS